MSVWTRWRTPASITRPVGGGDDARDHVERQDAVDRVALAVDREGDALVVQLGLGRPGAIAELGQAQRVEAGMDQLPVAGSAATQCSSSQK